MIANALIVTVAILLALVFWLMGELRFLVPYRLVLFHDYGNLLIFWSAILSVNVFAAVYAVQRKFFLKDTGRKLSHIEKQVEAGDSPMPSPQPPSEAA
jgi:hypothetical protein